MDPRSNNRTRQTAETFQRNVRPRLGQNDGVTPMANLPPQFFPFHGVPVEDAIGPLRFAPPLQAPLLGPDSLQARGSNPVRGEASNMPRDHERQAAGYDMSTSQLINNAMLQLQNLNRPWQEILADSSRICQLRIELGLLDEEDDEEEEEEEEEDDEDDEELREDLRLFYEGDESDDEDDDDDDDDDDDIFHDDDDDLFLALAEMSYEDLQELEEDIGSVTSGFNEHVIHANLRLSKYQSSEAEVDKCCICQEEYAAGEDTGKVDCGHEYHVHCITRWLQEKNICPVCNATALSFSPKS